MRLGPTADGRGGGGGVGRVRADLGSHKPVRVGKRRPESTLQRPFAPVITRSR